MLSIAIGISIMMTGYILKKYAFDLMMLESEIRSSFENNGNDASLSYEAIEKALENI